MGAGRSGSTLLDILIGNGIDMYSCGELVRVPELQGVPHGCNKEMPAYKFWNKIITNTEYIKSCNYDYDELERLVSHIDYHRAFPLNYFGLISSSNKRSYAKYVDSLYKSIFEHINENIIVDSSKYPSRALALNKYSSYSIKYVYLIRHPADVLKSFKKKGLEQPPKNTLSANVYYFLVNMACYMVLLRLKKQDYSIIQYNALVADPVRSLEKIQADLQINLTETISRVKNNEELIVANLFEGNRIRMKNSIKLQQKDYKRKYSITEWPTIILNWFWWVKSKY